MLYDIYVVNFHLSGIILDMGSANERRYHVLSSLIVWANTQNDPQLWVAISHILS